ncbi:MAG: QueT transporter family protein [Oscillospiraceae bacterium]
MKISTGKLAAAAVIGAAYAAMTMLLAPMSFGVLQLRVAEALCILPAFLPCAAWGLFAGCAISNLLSVLGPLDVIFGSLATLGACLCTAALGKGRTMPLSLGRSIAVCLMPALWNGPVIGAMLAYVAAPASGFLAVFIPMGAQIFAEELAVLLVLGLPLLRLLPNSKPFMELIKKI